MASDNMCSTIPSRRDQYGQLGVKPGQQVDGYPISSIQVLCGDATLVCASSNIASQVLYLYDDLYLVANGAKIGVVYEYLANPCSFTLLTRYASNRMFHA